MTTQTFLKTKTVNYYANPSIPLYSITAIIPIHNVEECYLVPPRYQSCLMLDIATYYTVSVPRSQDLLCSRISCLHKQ
jgi:hypothetical protein